MNKLRVFYRLDGQPRYEEFEPIQVHYGRKVYIDYYGMVQRAIQYAEHALPEIGAREVSVRWDE